jgi:hypothetical protein
MQYGPMPKVDIPVKNVCCTKMDVPTLHHMEAHKNAHIKLHTFIVSATGGMQE